MSAADALPPLSRAELHALATELRRTIDAGGYEGQPWTEAFMASAREAYTECLAEVKAAEQRAADASAPATGQQTPLLVVQNGVRAA
jgi:hypothetical protein